MPKTMPIAQSKVLTPMHPRIGRRHRADCRILPSLLASTQTSRVQYMHQPSSKTTKIAKPYGPRRRLFLHIPGLQRQNDLDTRGSAGLKATLRAGHFERARHRFLFNYIKFSCLSMPRTCCLRNESRSFYLLRSKLYERSKACGIKPVIWEFPKIGVPYLGVLIIRILLFRVLYWDPLFSETPIFL